MVRIYAVVFLLNDLNHFVAANPESGEAESRADVVRPSFLGRDFFQIVRNSKFRFRFRIFFFLSNSGKPDERQAVDRDQALRCRGHKERKALQGTLHQQQRGKGFTDRQ